MHEDAADGGPAEPAEELVRLEELQRERLQDDQEADRSGDEAVAGLVQDAADHRREEHAVGERPVGNGEAGAGRRHHRAGEDQEQSEDRDNLRKESKPGWNGENGSHPGVLYLNFLVEQGSGPSST